MSNLPAGSIGQYVASLQNAINDLIRIQQSIFLPNGNIAASGNLLMNGFAIQNAGQVTCGTLNYTTLNPPISDGGNITGPGSSTDNAIVRFDGITGRIAQNSTVTISDDAKIVAPGGTVDMSVAGTINIVATNANINGSPAVSSIASGVTDSDIPVWNSTSGLSLKTSGVQVSAIAAKLPLAGGTMTGAIAMATNNITNVGTLSGATNSRTADNIVSNASTGVADNIVSFSGGTGKVITDSSISKYAVTSNAASVNGLNSQLGNVIPRGAADTWTNVAPANSQSIIVYASSLSRMIAYSSVTNISYSNDNGTTWTLGTGLAASFFVAGWSGSVFAAIGVGSALSYTSADGITWSVQAAPPLAALTDVCRMEFISGLFMIGTSSGVSGIQTSPTGVTWTARAATRAPFRFAASSTTIVGATQSGFIYSTDGGITWINTADSFSCRSIAYSAERNEFIAGSSTTTTSYRSPDGITWTAFTTTLPSAIQHLFWNASTARYYFGAQDPTSLLYSLYSSVDGITTFTNIGTMQGATNVGTTFYDSFYITSLNRFYIISNNAPKIHYSTSSTTMVIRSSIYSPTTMAIDAATAINIGNAAITTTVNGIFASTVSKGSWYSTTSYNPSFSAGVNRLTPPTAATAGTLVDFTHSLGVLTYTGTRTRSFSIDYDVTWLAGANGTNMTFFNSIGASTTIGTQTQVRKQINANINATFMSVHFSDIISLATGNTVQLAGASAALSSAIAYQFVSCKIKALPD